jgi:hypothetical protein
VRFGTCAPLLAFEEHRQQDHASLFVGIKENDAVQFTDAKNKLDVDSLTSTACDPKVPLVLHVNGRAMVRAVVSSKRSVGMVLKEFQAAGFGSLTAEQCYANAPVQDAIGTLLVQGVSPMLSTPLDALYDIMASTDGFLHMVFWGQS